MKIRILTFFLFFSAILCFGQEPPIHELSFTTSITGLGIDSYNLGNEGNSVANSAICSPRITLGYKQSIDRFLLGTSITYNQRSNNLSGLLSAGYIYSHVLQWDLTGKLHLKSRNDLFSFDIGLIISQSYEDSIIHYEDYDDIDFQTEIPTWWYNAVLLPSFGFNIHEKHLGVGAYLSLSAIRFSVFADNREEEISITTSKKRPGTGPSHFSSFNDYLEIRTGSYVCFRFNDQWSTSLHSDLLFIYDVFPSGQPKADIIFGLTVSYGF